MPLSTCLAALALAGSSPADVDRLKALDHEYVEAWRQAGSAAQSAAVLPLFEEDAVIMPGLGTSPARGRAAISQFWFPAGPPTVITRFEHQIDAIETHGDLGFVSGRQRLDFTYGPSATRQEGNYMFVARRQGDGSWRIRRMIWNNRTLQD